MFDAELLGFTATQYWQFASVILTPTLGFVFVYLLNRPLKRLPLIDAGDDYQPPRWVLPVFAISSLFAATLSISLSAFMLLTVSRSSDSTFLRSYHLERSLEVPEDYGPIRIATVTLKQYDGYSNLDLFVNGYMAFSTETSCAMLYQCNDEASAVSVEENYKQVTMRYGSMHSLSVTNTLPLNVDLTKYLQSGQNHIDIVSVNSGIGDCALTLDLKLTFNSAELSKNVFILPYRTNSSEKLEGDVFYSYGSPPRNWSSCTLLALQTCLTCCAKE